MGPIRAWRLDRSVLSRFIYFPKPDAGAIVLVLQLIPERSPTRIQHGLGHARFRRTECIHITNQDHTMFFAKPGAQVVKKAFSAIGYPNHAAIGPVRSISLLPKKADARRSIRVKRFAFR